MEFGKRRMNKEIHYGITHSLYEDKWILWSLVDTDNNDVAKNIVFEGTYEECEAKMKQMKALDELAKQAQDLGLE
jgi:hypothetical protein